MSTMPKGHISLPPKPEPARRAEHPFVVPLPSVSINEAVFDNPEGDQSLADVKEAIGGLRKAVEAIQRGPWLFMATNCAPCQRGIRRVWNSLTKSRGRR